MNELDFGSKSSRLNSSTGWEEVAIDMAWKSTLRYTV